MTDPREELEARYSDEPTCPKCGDITEAMPILEGDRRTGEYIEVCYDCGWQSEPRTRAW